MVVVKMVDSTLLGTNFVFGFGMGYALGYFVKKAVKIFLGILALYVMSLFYLAEKGVIIIDQAKLNQLANEATNKILETFYTFGYATANALGVVGGFVLGFSKG